MGSRNIDASLLRTGWDLDDGTTASSPPPRQQTMEPMDLCTPMANRKRGRPLGSFGNSELRSHLKTLPTPIKESPPRHQPASRKPVHFCDWMISGMTSLPKAIHQCSSIVSKKSKRIQKSVENLTGLANLYLSPVAKPTFMSATIEANILQSNRKTVSKDRLALGSLVYECSRILWVSLLKYILARLQNQEVTGLLLFPIAQFDSTPTQLNLHEFTQELDASPAGQPDNALPDKDDEPAEKERQAKRTVSVVQAELQIAIVLLQPDGKPIAICGELLCRLQAIESGNARTYRTTYECFVDLPILEELRPFFKLPIRGTTTDRDAALKLMFKAIRHARPEWGHLNMPCQIHDLTTGAKHASKVVDADVSGCVNLSLAMRGAGSVKALRACFQKAIANHLDIYPGPPPSDTSSTFEHKEGVARKHKLFDLCLPDGDRSAELRKIRLSRFLNGLISPRLQFFGRLDRETVSRRIAMELLPAAIKIFPRHRWLTSGKSFADSALLFGIGDDGDIAAEALSDWLGCDAANTPGYGADGSWEPDVTEPTCKNSNSKNKDAAEPALDVGSFFEELRQQAKMSLPRWIPTQPAARLVILLLAMGPTLHATASCLHMGSSEWDLEQMAAQMKGLPYKFRVTQAYLGSVGQKSFRIRGSFWTTRMAPGISCNIRSVRGGHLPLHLPYCRAR
jgi:hypothetical protein